MGAQRRVMRAVMIANPKTATTKLSHDSFWAT